MSKPADNATLILSSVSNKIVTTQTTPTPFFRPSHPAKSGHVPSALAMGPLFMALRDLPVDPIDGMRHEIRIHCFADGRKERLFP